MTQPSAAAPSDGASPNAPGAGEDDRLRTTRLFLLAAGLFVFLTAEMYPVGAMPDMTRDLGESDAAYIRGIVKRQQQFELAGRALFYLPPAWPLAVAAPLLLALAVVLLKKQET